MYLLNFLQVVIVLHCDLRVKARIIDLFFWFLNIKFLEIVFDRKKPLFYCRVGFRCLGFFFFSFGIFFLGGSLYYWFQILAKLLVSYHTVFNKLFAGLFSVFRAICYIPSFHAWLRNLHCLKIENKQYSFIHSFIYLHCKVSLSIMLNSYVHYL